MKLFYSLFIIKLGTASRILFLQPHISKSHANFNDAITQSLLEVGHQVTAFTSLVKTIKHPNYTVVYSERSHSGSVLNYLPMDQMLKNSNNFYLLNAVTRFGIDDCYRIIQLDEMQQIIKSKEKLFDLLIIDMMLTTNECFLPLAEIFSIPVIGTIPMRSWRNSEWFMGNSYNPSTVSFDLSYNSHEMNFWQRLENTVDCAIDILYKNYIVNPKIDEFYRQYFPKSTTARRRIESLLFTNGHSALNSRPMLPTIINLGGIHVPLEKPLPKNLQTFIDAADQGVILFTVGSLLQSHKMPAKVLSIFREVFAQIPERVIWKAEEDIESLSDNVLLSKWLPQRDILAHRNVVAFITHAGLSGIYESLYGGVPMVLIPTFYDQMSNAAILHQLELGILVDLAAITKRKLLDALNEVINGTKYRQRTKEFSSLLKDQPLKPKEQVIYWTEYILRHNGTEHFNTITSKMPSYQYLLLDVMGFLLVLILAAGFTCYYLLRWIRRNVFSNINYLHKKLNSRHSNGKRFIVSSKNLKS